MHKMTLFVDLKDHNKNTRGIFWQGIYLLLVFIFISEMVLQQVQSTPELVGNNFIFLGRFSMCVVQKDNKANKEQA